MAYESRNEQILRAMIDGTEYTEEPQNRIEALLLELKATIEQGGGNSGHVYDNTEKVVGTWFGDTLYEKTVNVSSLSCITSDYFGSYSGSLDLSGYIGNFKDVFVDLDMSYLTTSGGVKERFVLVQAPPNSTSINLFTCASRSNVSAVLTIKYTKSST